MALPRLHERSVVLLRAGKTFIFAGFLIVSQEMCLLGKNESGRAAPSVSSTSEVL